MISVLYGDGFENFVQHTIGQAWRKQTPEALDIACHELQGLKRFLFFTRTDNPQMILSLSNHQSALKSMAQALREGYKPS